MPDYDLYDKVVAEALTELLEVLKDKAGLKVNNDLETDKNKFFIEVGKMATHLSGTQLYVSMSFFAFWSFKLHNRKLMKGVKRFKKADDNIILAPTYRIEKNILEKFNLKNKDILKDIYKEYYQIG